jgi:hypothetical protein
MIKFIILAILYVTLFINSTSVFSQQSVVQPIDKNQRQTDPYCTIKQETVIDQNSNDPKLNKETTKSIITCDDGPMNTITKTGIAENCQEFTWNMPLGGRMVEQKSVACKKIGGGYEIIPKKRIVD